MKKSVMGWSMFGALLISMPVYAADSSGAILWSAHDFKGFEKSLVPKMDATKGGNAELIKEKTYNAIVFHREGSGPPEQHEKLADFMVVKSGEGAIQVGGKLIDAKPSGVNELRGSALEGGTKYPVSAGDVLYIPANTPHRTLVEAGKQLNVMVIKVQP